jgi:hypothetical protein
MLCSRSSLHDRKPAEAAQQIERPHRKHFSFDMVVRAAALSDTKPISARVFPKYNAKKTGIKETCHA